MSFIPIGKVKTFCSHQHQSHQSHSCPHSHVQNLHQSLEFLREEFCFPIQSPSPPHPYSSYFCLQMIVIFNWLVFSHNKVRRWMGHCWPNSLLWWNNHLSIGWLRPWLWLLDKHHCVSQRFNLSRTSLYTLAYQQVTHLGSQ